MRKFILTSLLVMWLGVIYFLSSQNGTESSGLSNGLLFEIACFLNVKDVSSFISRYGLFIRKLAHFSEYFILAVIMYFCFREYSKKPVYLACLILCALYATSDEIHQLFINERCFSVLDILLDSFGSFVALFFLNLINSKCCQEKKL